MIRIRRSPFIAGTDCQLPLVHAQAARNNPSRFVAIQRRRAHHPVTDKGRRTSSIALQPGPRSAPARYTLLHAIRVVYRGGGGLLPTHP
jgi:hypothetical protein